MEYLREVACVPAYLAIDAPKCFGTWALFVYYALLLINIGITSIRDYLDFLSGSLPWRKSDIVLMTMNRSIEDPDDTYLLAFF